MANAAAAQLRRASVMATLASACENCSAYASRRPHRDALAERVLRLVRDLAHRWIGEVAAMYDEVCSLARRERFNATGIVVGINRIVPLETGASPHLADQMAAWLASKGQRKE
jgi:hypothetical protein